MPDVRFTLVTDGSSDRALIPLLRWLIRRQEPQSPINGDWADFRRLRRPPRTLADRLTTAIDLFPCNLLFIHRDAERQSRDLRLDEITGAVTKAFASGGGPPIVPIIPIRMMEAWLLLDDAAIRRAAGNPNGREELTLPSVGDIEGLPDPKRALESLIIQASGLGPQRFRRLNWHPSLVAERTDDFSPLLALSAFAALETDLRVALSREL